MPKTAELMDLHQGLLSGGAEAAADDSITAPVTLLICDDHRVLSDALAMLVGIDPRLRLLADPFVRAEAAVEAAVALRPDVVLMDVELQGDMNGIEATYAITQRCPRTKVVVVSGSGDPSELLVQAINAGAAGFLPKTEGAATILASIRLAAAGESLLDQATLVWAMRQVAAARTAQRAVDERKSRLTGRERVILQRISEGRSNDGIADDLFLSIHTVNTHVRNILVKLEVHSKLQAVAWAVKSGAVTVDR